MLRLIGHRYALPTLKPSEPPFPHRINGDGTFDSICPRCFVTVGTSNNEAELEQMEAAHICESSRLRYYDEKRYNESRKPPREEPSDPANTIQGTG